MLHFATAIKNSFKNGYAKEYLDSLFCLMKHDKYFWQTYRKTEMDNFLLKVTHQKYFKSKKPVPNIKTRKSSKSESSSSVSGTKKSSSTSGSKSHYASDVRTPDFVVFKRTSPESLSGECAIVFEVKCDHSNSSIRDGISQLLSYGFSMRCQQKGTKEMALILITPRIWLLTKLPPFGEKVKNSIVFSVLKIFDHNLDGDYGFQEEKYIWFMKFLSQY